MEDAITIIIAAYKRPEALKLALESVFAQSYPHWKVLIIADCCEQSFIDQFQDIHPAVTLINLTKRCGNQYGPNSLGIHLAKTRFLTFLNHDDILLSDHLATAIQTLRKHQANFYLGTGAYCHYQNQDKFIDTEKRLLFSEKNRSYAIWRCIKEDSNNFFEPGSTFVLETELARQAGYWRSPSESYLPPLLDWVSRVMRCQPIICHSNKITTLKFNLHHTRSGGGDYSQDHYIEFISCYIKEEPEHTRQLISDDLEMAENRGLLVRPELTAPMKMEDEAEYILDFMNFLNGENDVLSGEVGTHSDFFLNVIENRTGERLHEFIPSEELIRDYIRAQHEE